MLDNIIKLNGREYPIIILKDICLQQERIMINDYYASYDKCSNTFTESIDDICHKYNINESGPWFSRNIVQKYTERVIIGKCSRCQTEIMKSTIGRDHIKHLENILVCDACVSHKRKEAIAEKLREKSERESLKEKEIQYRKELDRLAKEQKLQKRELLFKKAIQRQKWIELTQSQLDALFDICEMKETDLICKIIFSGNFSNRTIWKDVIEPITQRGLMEVEAKCKFCTHPELLAHLKEYQLSRDKELSFEVSRVLKSVDENISLGVFKVETPYTIYPKRFYSLEIKSSKEKLFLKIETSK